MNPYHPFRRAWERIKLTAEVLFQILAWITVIALIVSVPFGLLYLVVKIIRLAWGT